MGSARPGARAGAGRRDTDSDYRPNANSDSHALAYPDLGANAIAAGRAIQRG